MDFFFVLLSTFTHNFKIQVKFWKLKIKSLKNLFDIYKVKKPWFLIEN